MSGSARSVWIWQEIVSPHMAALGVALSRRGCRTVYVAQRLTSTTGDRASQGWANYDMGDVDFRLAGDPAAVRDLVRSADAGSVHICESLRPKGSAAEARSSLAKRGLRQWAIMEMVQDGGWRGAARRLIYRAQALAARKHLQGVLAIGHGVPEWITARGFPGARVFPFTYFLDQPADTHALGDPRDPGAEFVVAFAGQLIERKRIDLLVRAISMLGREDVRLQVVGAGPLEHELRHLAESLIPGKVTWLGRLPFSTVPGVIARADCLVLPSRFDGWGAVVSEALMRGTPAICSSRCGARVAVEASGTGGVFESGSADSLAAVLGRQVDAGGVTGDRRQRLARWSACLNSESGAQYLLRILEHSEGNGPRPAPPWTASAAAAAGGRPTSPG